jgi:hypothetical protein
MSCYRCWASADVTDEHLLFGVVAEDGGDSRGEVVRGIGRPEQHMCLYGIFMTADGRDLKRLMPRGRSIEERGCEGGHWDIEGAFHDEVPLQVLAARVTLRSLHLDAPSMAGRCADYGTPRLGLPALDTLHDLHRRLKQRSIAIVQEHLFGAQAHA